MSIALQYAPRETALAPSPVSKALPAMVRKAADQLASATSAAEVLEARNTARAGRDLHKREASILKAKGAHSEIIAKVRRGQADCLELEAMADKRLADEYDAAQERGEVASQTDGRRAIGVPGGNAKPTVADIGLSRKDIHEARQVRDAEQAEPGVVRRALDAQLDAGKEPTKTALREAVIEAAKIGLRGGQPPRPSNKNPNYVDDPTYRMLLEVVGPCRALIEKVEAGDIQISMILTAFLDPSHRERSLRHVEQARDFLNKFLEAAHAH